MPGRAIAAPHRRDRSTALDEESVVVNTRNDDDERDLPL
jgi:hypothetical protein